MNNVTKAIKIATRILELAAIEKDRVMVFEKGTEAESRMSITEAANVLSNYDSCFGLKLGHGQSSCARCINGWAEGKDSPKKCKEPYQAGGKPNDIRNTRH